MFSRLPPCPPPGWRSCRHLLRWRPWWSVSCVFSYSFFSGFQWKLPLLPLSASVELRSYWRRRRLSSASQPLFAPVPPRCLVLWIGVQDHQKWLGSQGQCFLPLGEGPFAIGEGDVLAVEMGMFRSLWSHPGDQLLWECCLPQEEGRSPLHLWGCQRGGVGRGGHLQRVDWRPSPVRLFLLLLCLQWGLAWLQQGVKEYLF